MASCYFKVEGVLICLRLNVNKSREEICRIPAAIEGRT